MLTELTAIIAKEIKQTVRDKKMIGLLIAAPVIQLTVLGFSADLNVTDVRTIVADEDHTAASRELAEGLLAGETFEDVGSVLDGQAASQVVAAGQAAIALVIPPGYARALSEDQPASVQVLVDGGNSVQGVISQNAVATYVAQRSLTRMRGRLVEAASQRGLSLDFAPVRVEPRTLYNQSLESALHFVPGIGAILLMVVTCIVTALGLSREDEAGTLEQVLVTPLSPTTFVLGKTLPYAFIGLVDLALVVTAGAVIFAVPIRGSLLALFLAGFLYMLTTLGLGLLAGTMANSQQQAFFNASFILMPAMILSGFISPIEAMPSWLQPITLLDPVRHFVEILRAVLLKGATVADLAPAYLALAGMGLIMFPVAAWALSRKLR